MNLARQRSQTKSWKPPRDKKEVVKAVFAAAGVFVVTVVAIGILAPRDDKASPAKVTTTLPTSSSVPGESTTPLVPPDATAPSVPPESSSPSSTP